MPIFYFISPFGITTCAKPGGPGVRSRCVSVQVAKNGVYQALLQFSHLRYICLCDIKRWHHNNRRGLKERSQGHCATKDRLFCNTGSDPGIFLIFLCFIFPFLVLLSFRPSDHFHVTEWPPHWFKQSHYGATIHFSLWLTQSIWPVISWL